MDDYTIDSGNWKYTQFMEDMDTTLPKNLNKNMEDSFQELMKNHKFKSISSNKKLRKPMGNSELSPYKKSMLSRNTGNRYTIKSVSTLPNLPRKALKRPTVSQEIDKSINKKFNKKLLKERMSGGRNNTILNAYKLDNLIRKYNPKGFNIDASKNFIYQ